MTEHKLIQRKKAEPVVPQPAPLVTQTPAPTTSAPASPGVVAATPMVKQEREASPGEQAVGHEFGRIAVLQSAGAAGVGSPPAAPPGGAMPPGGGNGVAGNAPDAIAGAARSIGQPLPPDLQQRFAESLGGDLSGVRIHTSAASAEAAEAISARAYTLGQDIHFRPGQYDPLTPAGQRLLAHEVAHTAQQRKAGEASAGALEVSSPGEPLEMEAHRAAEVMLSGAPVEISVGPPVGRQVWRDPQAVLDQKKKDLEDDTAVEKKAAEQKKAPPPNKDIDAGTQAATAAAEEEMKRQVQVKESKGAHGQLQDKAQIETVIKEIRGQTRRLGEFLGQEREKDREAPGGEDPHKRTKSGAPSGVHKTEAELAPLYTKAAEKKAENDKTETELRAYADQLVQQETTGDLFTMTYNALKVNAAAFEGRFNEFTKAHPKLGLPEKDHGLSGKGQAGAVIKGGGPTVGQGAAQIKAAFDRPELRAQKETIRQIMLDLQEMPAKVPQKMGPVSQAVQEVQTAVLNVSAGTIVRGASEEAKKAQEQVKAIEGELSQTVSDIGAIMSTVQLAGGALGAMGAGLSSMGKVGEAISGAFDDPKGGSATDAAVTDLTGGEPKGTDFGVNPKGTGLGKTATALPGQVGTATGGKIEIDIKKDIAKYLMNYNARIAKANAGLSAVQDAEARLSLKVQIDQLTNAKGRLQLALSDFIALCEDMAKKRQRLQEAIASFSKSLGAAKPGQPNMAQVLQFQVDAQSLAVAADTALQTGNEQKTKANAAMQQRKAVVGSEEGPGGKSLDKTQGGMKWWKVISGNDKEFWAKDCILALEEQTVSVTGKDKMYVVVNGVRVDESIVVRQEMIEKQIEEVTKIKTNAEAFRDRLATLTGI